jgi:CRISPR-associated protein Cas5d
VCAPVRFDNIRRNEVSFKANSFEPKSAAENRSRSQRAALVLRDVHYVVEAHFMLTDKAGSDDNEGKFVEMIRRRLRKGQNFHTPYLGVREFPAKIRLIEAESEVPSPIPDTRSLGLMFYDMEYDIETAIDGTDVVKAFKPTYFIAEMKDGAIDLRDVEVLR